MELLKFMNAHNNWQELLAAEPYNIDIRQDGDYYILKYNMLLSNMALPEVLEARGSIFRQNEDGMWICVCHPFDKFFNYGEKYSAVHDIDWETATVQQKVDGSLIKIWWDREEWHISTNGSIDAFKAECGNITYGDLVISVISNIENFWEELDSTYCYMFELTSPYNHIVVKYEGTKLWLLGARNMLTDEEVDVECELDDIEIPTFYSYHSLSECIAAAHKMGDDEEGYVVCDANFNRIKIKGDEYLKLHKLRGNGPLTILRIVEMWQNEVLDDFIAYYPEFKEFIDKVLNCIRHWISAAELAYGNVSSISISGDRKSFAMNSITYLPIIRAYLFAHLDEKVDTATNYMKNMRSRTLASYIAAEIGNIEKGVASDE